MNKIEELYTEKDHLLRYFMSLEKTLDFLDAKNKKARLPPTDINIKRAQLSWLRTFNDEYIEQIDKEIQGLSECEGMTEAGGMNENN